MLKEKRHAGRAIRKQRREAVEAMSSIDWHVVGRAFEEVGRGLAVLIDAVALAAREFGRAYMEAVADAVRRRDEQERFERMAFRSLTAAPTPIQEVRSEQ